MAMPISWRLTPNLLPPVSFLFNPCYFYIIEDLLSVADVITSTLL